MDIIVIVICYYCHVLLLLMMADNVYRVLVKFVVGSEPCSVPVSDRLSQYSCDEWNVSVPGLSILAQYSHLI